MATFDSYIICTSPRSGSTLLCKLLEATGVAGNPGSHFHDPSIADWLEYYDLTADPELGERETLAKVFDAAVEYGSSGTCMFGLRLQRHSFEFFMEKLAVLYAGHSSDVQRLEAAFGRTRFIHLTREDKVQQAVSYVKASQSGLWHQAPDGTELERLSPPQEPVYDGEQVRAQYDEFVAYDNAWEEWFRSQEIEPFRLTYDELSADPAAILRQVLGELGVETVAADGVEPRTAKLADEVSWEWVNRFRSETS